MHEERNGSDRADDAESAQPCRSGKNAEGASSSTDQRKKKQKNGWIRSPACRCQRLRQILAGFPFLCNFILMALLVTPGSAQFGEIASLITGILGSGGAGLAGTGAGLAGTAGSLAGAGSAAGAGASSALSNIGPLYQLAQAALQLTGTGVGIANQASEGAWFPVAVENAARMNRDFQDRLLGRRVRPEGSGGGGGGEGGVTDNTEYGRNFGSGELTSTDNADGDGDSFLGGSSAGRPPPFGGLLGGGGNSNFASASAGRVPTPLLPQLPGLESLLPGETPPRGVRIRGGSTSAPLPTTGGGGGTGGNSLERFGAGNGKGDASTLRGGGGASGSGGGRVIGIGTVEQVPLSPPIDGTGPKIRVELPDKRQSVVPDERSHHRLPGGGSEKKEPSIEFSVDDGASSETNDRDDDEDASSSVKGDGHSSAAFGTPLLPSTFTGEDSELISSIGAGRQSAHRTSASAELRTLTTGLSARQKAGEAEADPVATAQSMAALIARQIDDGRMPEMVPELRRLVQALRDSRLTREEFLEIANQLESNKDLLSPRENTTPSPESVVTGVYHQTGDDNTDGGSASASSSDNAPSPNALLFGGQRDRAALRNLSAFRGALDDVNNASLSPADTLALGGQRGNRTAALRNLAALRSALRGEVEAETSGASSSRPASDASMAILRRLRLTNTSSDANVVALSAARPVVLAMEDARAHHLHTVGGGGSHNRLMSMSSEERLQRAKAHAVVPYRRRIEDKTPSGDKSIVVSGLAAPSSATPTANTPLTFIFDTATPTPGQPVHRSANTQQPHQIFTQPQPASVTATQPYQQTYQPQPQQQQLPQQQQQLQAQQLADYNRAYRDYINYYYPQYAQLYNTLHPQHSAATATGAAATQQQSQSQPLQSDTARAQPVPRRVVPEPVATTPPSSLQHPFSQGALLTLMQPPQQPAAAAVVPPSLPQLFQPPPPSQWGRRR